MILRLRIADFGKFKDRTFELGPVTVVHGPNEAGKTTFFDALHHALCKPSETKVNGKRHKARYGAGRRAEVDLTGPFEIDEDEFFNLSAIRAGDLSLDMGKGAPWLDRLKSRLFHGGLDPAALAAEFARRSSDSRTLLHMKELEKLRAQVAAKREDLGRLQRERDALLSREQGLAAAEADLARLRNTRMQNQEERKAVAEKIAFEERIEKRRKLSAALARYEEGDALENTLKELEPYREDRRAEWETLTAATGAAKEKAQADRVRHEAAVEALGRAQEALAQEEKAKDFWTERSALATRCAADLRALDSRPQSAPPVLFPILAFLGPAAGCFFAPGIAFKAVGMVFSLLLALIAFHLLRRRAAESEASRREKEIARIKDAFRVGELDLHSRHPSAPAVDRNSLAEITTPEALLQIFDRLVSETSARDRHQSQMKRDLEPLEADRRKWEEVGADSARKEVEARRAETEWLTRHGVSKAEEYFQKAGRYSQALENLARRKVEAEAGAVDAAEERREISRQIKDLDEEGVPRQGLDPAAFQCLRQRARELETIREQQDREEKDLLGSTSHQAGEIRGTLGKLAGEIVRCEEELLQREAQVEEKELDRRAAAIAHGIFKEIGEGADLLLAGLARELGAVLEPILPGGRAVALLGLDKSQITVDDAGGARRPLENLSTGTQDAVVLAAKLALALKTREGAGLLVLDDPFLAMDRDREEKALGKIRQFHLRHGWQIILLTKDAHLRDAMRSRFAECRTVELGTALPA